jgi:hypothetical protein
LRKTLLKQFHTTAKHFWTLDHKLQMHLSAYQMWNTFAPLFPVQQAYFLWDHLTEMTEPSTIKEEEKKGPSKRGGNIGQHLLLFLVVF